MIKLVYKSVCNLYFLYFSETGSDDSVNTPDPKSSPQKKSALTKKKKSTLPKKQKPKVEVDYELKVQPSTSTSDNTLIVPYSENCSEQIQIVSPANLSVKEVKLETVQEVVVPVIVQAPDYTGYASVAPLEVAQQPEVGYYNFSLELLKSFSERFQGQVSIDGLLMSPLKKFPGFIFLQFIFKFINNAKLGYRIGVNNF